MVGEANKNLVRRFFEAVNRADYSVLDHVLARNFVRHCQATPDVTVESAEDYKQFDRASRRTFPDQHVVLEQVVADGEYVACWCRYQGTQEGYLGGFQASNKRTDVEFAAFFRVEDGRLAEAWETWDNLTVLHQLGHYPPSGTD